MRQQGLRAPAATPARSDGACAVSVAGLVKRYGSMLAVDHLDFRIEFGELVAILGPNGAGKTTTLEIIEGLRTADGGEVQVLGRSPRAARRLVGVQLQEGSSYAELTCAETLRHFARLYDANVDARALLELVGLSEMVNRRSDRLSGGQKRRLQLALALCNDPELIVLDEPTTGLDPISRREAWDLVRALHDEGRTIVLTTHYIEEAEALADRVILIDRGRVVVEGSPRELIASLGEAVHIEVAAPEHEELALVPGVDSARYAQGLWHLRSFEPGKVLADLSNRLGTSGLQQLAVRGPTLEDVFLAYAGHQIEAETR